MVVTGVRWKRMEWMSGATPGEGEERREGEAAAGESARAAGSPIRRVRRRRRPWARGLQAKAA
ncbi:MAG: hypothetical protein INR71_00340 [Terriglobus roseus]|nr:hypothetical protein [Terriglobus roseus]